MSLEHWVNLLDSVLQGGIRADSPDLASSFARFAIEWPNARPAQVVDETITLPTSRAEELGLLGYARAVMQGPSAAALLPLEEPLPPGRLSARMGRTVVRAAWLAVARQAAVGSVRRPAAIEALLQSHDGRTFLEFHNDDPPEAWWYDELVLLHAVTTCSVLSHDPQARRVAMASAGFCHREIQPDHATGLPWALHAFVLNADTHLFADWLVNACLVQYAGEPRGLALVLLADALYCLKHVVRAGTSSGL
ncbi:MAG: hypothetical protein NZ561_00650 [Phycisphaerae bacterium]|nr:hypothetical protein [Phycisphaerae bacterium]MDW8261040.1 hypothetical protein [Phycisphaerales bacterium]